ncbi:MAG: DNA cytosine methyltransferase [Candidatus Aenigmarchaeota archaeon]|nr:DNA cytosine methyltransferase [Candidatus Aenigmarchaeota archaeon]
MSKSLTVLDFFCGAGGFSEGFKQLGFDVVYGADNWNPAIQTFKANNSDAEVVKVDVLELSATDVPKADVIIGGPPCTEFSGSNRGGSGNVKEGMELVKRFLYYVHELKPRWWIMENVPRLLQTLPPKFRLKDLGIDKEGIFEIPKMQVFNAADFGAPQKRTRLLSGKYPNPLQTHSENPVVTLNGQKLSHWFTMRKVIESFPNPLNEPRKGKHVKDPNYNFNVTEMKLEDHFGDHSIMKDEEAERNKRQKTEHPYYGKMKFPDDLDRPSRTVMATQFNASRETMVIAMSNNGRKIIYRKPTIRECASLQCYPINYKFIGTNPTTKYKLVGNSVPVKLSMAVAKAILREAGMRTRKN